MRKSVYALGCVLGLSVAAVGAQDLPVKNAKRIVAMDFGALDTLAELGAANKVVALPKENAPEYMSVYTTAAYQNTGGMKSPDLAVIKAAKPDVIIMTGRQNAAYDELVKIAPTIRYATDSTKYLASAKDNTLMLGEMVGNKALAEQKWAALEAKVKGVQAQADASPLKATVMLHNGGKLMVSNSGYAGFIHDVLHVKKADANVGDERVVVDAAYLNKVNPDLIYIIDRSGAIGQPPLDMKLFADKNMQNVKAVKNQKVVVLTPKLWYLSGGGLQSIALQADEVAKHLGQ
ncbi:MAG: ABC transporter substrate-binding protein [Neisseriaceae bacterium]|nr:ABC transporter substrate-binding protein [Neisseriaceae bacterium]MBP6862049.1 ABC transporter substrate-binding protein [Neisseriaceae bacterium]